jgi:N-dimethylarginine dimethylaminohydrolase
MFSDIPIRYNAPWHNLKHVCVGATYGPEFYEPIQNLKVRDKLQRIAWETVEDYNYLIQVLSDLDIQVEQIQLDSNKTIMDYVDDQGRIGYNQTQSFTLIPRPPMQPRDSVLIVNDCAVLTNPESQWFAAINTTATRVIKSTRPFDAPLATVIGNTIIVDCRDHEWLADFLQETFPTHRVVPVHIGGHNDAVFSVVAPGVIVSTYHHTNYAETFPGWEIKFINNQSWNAIPNWRKFKHSNRDKWWTPDRDSNPEFCNFVDSWLTNWVGFVAESVFDVNMLQINQNCVLVNNYNQDLFDFLKNHKIEPIVVPFRHRFFWDGGLHCITNDLYREGECEQYL